MIPNPPQGQGPIDPQGVFVPPPTPAQASRTESGSAAIEMMSMTNPTPMAGAPAGGYGPPSGWPMMSFYPPPQPPRRWRWILLLGMGLFGAIVTFMVISFAMMAGGGDGEPIAVSQVLRKGDSKQQIAVVEVAGPIDGNTSARFARLMDHVERQPDVHALVIEVDSPGGTVTASDEIYDRILRYKKSRQATGRNTGVVITIRSMATSGGYYVSCAGDYLFAEQTTLTGNIGVLMSRFNVSELMQKHGVTEVTIVATGADYKNAGSPFAPETEEGKAYLKGLVDDAFNRFKFVVTSGRGKAISGKDIFNGKVFTGGDALKNGLVDAIGYPQDAYDHAATKVAALTNPHVVRFREPKPGLLSVLVGGSEADAATPQPAAQSLDLSNLARPETLDAWRTMRLLYR